MKRIPAAIPEQASPRPFFNPAFRPWGTIAKRIAADRDRAERRKPRRRGGKAQR